MDGNYHPSFKVADAVTAARNYNMQVVCFNRAEGETLAFCRVIDYNKWQYQEEKKKKKQQVNSRRETKEIRLSPNIADNDVDHKMKQVNELLDDGDEVVLTMKLKGRDRLHMSEAEIKMNEILKKCTKGGEASRKKTDNMIIVRLTKGAKVETNKKEIVK